MLGSPCITLACLVASCFPASWCLHLPGSDNPELGVYVCSDGLLIPTTSQAAAALGLWSRGGLVPLRGCWGWTFRVLALLVRSGFPAHWTQGVYVVTQEANRELQRGWNRLFTQRPVNGWLPKAMPWTWGAGTGRCSICTTPQPPRPKVKRYLELRDAPALDLTGTSLKPPSAPHAGALWLTGSLALDQAPNSIPAPHPRHQ